jgi:hypothetical protein
MNTTTRLVVDTLKKAGCLYIFPTSEQSVAFSISPGSCTKEGKTGHQDFLDVATRVLTGVGVNVTEAVKAPSLNVWYPSCRYQVRYDETIYQKEIK